MTNEENETTLPKPKTTPTVSITIPYRLVSEANMSDHWTLKHKRKKKLCLLLLSYLPDLSDVKLPCIVTLTRVAPRMLDDDNLRGAFKYVRDYVADKLVPGLQPGRADDDCRITWEYGQKKSLRPKEYAIIVRIDSKLTE